jgi:hypothetical protein
VATPAAGRNIPYQFPADAYRNAIRFVFEMETDPDADNRITFYFENTVTYGGAADSDKVPFDWTQSATVTASDPVNVPCDIEFVGAPDEPTAFGSVVASKIKVLLLDEDYDQVKDATYVILNGDRYKRDYEQPSFGLFTVGLHTIVFTAEDEV